MSAIQVRRATQFIGALFCLLLIPVLFFQKWKPGFQSPGARSGDEPHYLVMVHSIVKDFDLAIANNYSPIFFASDKKTRPADPVRPSDSEYSVDSSNPGHLIRSGDYPQGVYLSGFPLSRHTNLVPADGTTGTGGTPRKIYRWDEVYHFVPAGGIASRDESLPFSERFLATPRPGFVDFECESCEEVAWHPLGYPVLLSILAFPLVFFGSYWTELWVVVLQFALYAFALWRVRELIPIRWNNTGDSQAADQTDNSSQALLPDLSDLFLVLSTGMALSAYYFAASIYTEGVAPALLLLAVVGFARQRPLEISLYLGFLFFIKESYAPLGPIFAGVYWLKSRRLRDLFVMAAFPLVAFGLFAARNLYFYGAPFQTYYPWAWSPDPGAGALGLLFAAKKGVLVFTPVFILFLAGLWPLFHRRPYVALVTGATYAYFFLLTSATAYWSGGPTYGYRLLTPAVAILTPAFFAWLAMVRGRNDNTTDDAPGTQKRKLPRLFRRILLGITLILLGVSTVNGFFGATNLNYAYDTETYINLIQPEQSQLYRRLNPDQNRP